MKIFRYMPYYLIFLGLLVLVVAGIYIFTHVSYPEERRQQSGNLKVAIILPGSSDDQSWSASGYKGLMMVKQEFGAEVAYSQNVSREQAPAELRRYAKEGFDFIIANGGEYSGAADTVAHEFPAIKFMVTGSNPGNNQNLGTMSFNEEESSFLAGAAAGLVSHGKVAFVGGEDLPHVMQAAHAFEQGARFVNPNIETKIVFLGTWTEQQKGIDAGKALIAEKFDVIAITADAAGKPIHGLARSAGIKTIGWVTDEYELAPGTVITSVIADNSQLILKGTQLVARGHWEGKQYKFGIKDGVMRLADFRGSLDGDKIRKISEIRQALQDGLISPLPPVATAPSGVQN